MQPRTLVLLITLLPLLVSNAVYLLSAYEGSVPWCIPYIDGCTTISRAARSGNSIYIFRAVMIAQGLLLIWFWIYARNWLNLLAGHKTNITRIIFWLGVTGAIFLIVYVDYLGSTGEVNRFMRRYGIMIFYTLTPLAQLLMLKQHYVFLSSAPEITLNFKTIKRVTLRYQLSVLLLMLTIAIISTVLDITQNKSYESENIVEWNFSLLMNLYFAGMFFIWKDYRYYLKNSSSGS